MNFKAIVFHADSTWVSGKHYLFKQTIDSIRYHAKCSGFKNVLVFIHKPPGYPLEHASSNIDPKLEIKSPEDCTGYRVYPQAIYYMAFEGVAKDMLAQAFHRNPNAEHFVVTWDGDEFESVRKRIAEIAQPSDKELLDWYESCHTLHWNVEVTYVVDGYVLQFMYDGTAMKSVGGATVRSAMHKGFVLSPDGLHGKPQNFFEAKK